MSDLIERLRKNGTSMWLQGMYHREGEQQFSVREDCAAAADEIDRLRRELAEARGVLIKTAEWLRDPQWGTWPYMEGSAIYDDKADALDDIDAFLAEKP